MIQLKTVRKVLVVLLTSYSFISIAQKTGTIILNFENIVGNEPVVLNTKNYTNALGEQFNISLLNYYISNIRLVKADGSEYIVPQNESYFLVSEERPATKSITIQNIPKGNYTAAKFIIGIDSTKSASDISERKGCLDVGGEAKDMYWAWNSGYIFVKMEGKSPQNSKYNSVYNYHIGFFGGIGEKKTLNNIKTAKIDFGGKAIKLKSKKQIEIVIKTDVSKILNGPTNISIAKDPSVMGGPLSAKIADNYKNMLSFGSINK